MLLSMSTLFPYTTLFRSGRFDPAEPVTGVHPVEAPQAFPQRPGMLDALLGQANGEIAQSLDAYQLRVQANDDLQNARSEEHTSELQSRGHLVCRLLPEKK